MSGPVPDLGGLSPCLFNPEVCQFVVNVRVVVGVIVVVVSVVGGNIIIVALLVVDWGSATVAATVTAGTGFSFCKHRAMVAVLAEVSVGA